MDSQQLKLIGNKISQGLFEDYIDVLETPNFQISQKQAIYLLVCCCTTCNVNIETPQSLSEQNVMILVKTVSTRIVKVISEDYDVYLQSMFFICKFLLRKNLKLVLQLKTEIIPTFIPDSLSEKQKGIYRSLCELIRGEITNIISRKELTDKDEMVSMGYLLSEILIKSNNQHVFSEVIYNYGTCLMILNINLNLQYNYFIFNCELVRENISKDVLHDTVLHFIKYGMHIFALNLRNGILVDAENTIKKLLSVTPILKEWKNLKIILEICEHLINTSIKLEELKKYKDLFFKSAELYKKNENFLNLCKTIPLAVNSFSNFCKNHDTEKRFCNPEVHLCIYEIFFEIMEYFINLPKANDDKGVTIIREVSELAISITVLFNTLLSNEHISNKFTTKVLSYLEKYCEYLVPLKDHYDKLDITWSEISAHLYNLGVIYFRKHDNEGTLCVSHMILKYHFLLGKLEDQSILPNTMSLLCSVYLKEKQYLKAVTWTSMQIIYTKDTSKINVFHKLLKIKASAREDNAPREIQEFTVCSVIQHIPPEYKCYIGILQNLQTQIDLLMYELEVYHQKWKSKIPMMSAFRQLCKIADNFTLMEVFIKVFSDWETHVHETVVELLEKIFVEYEMSVKNSKTRKQRISLLFLYFFRYKIDNVEIISKNIQEMTKTSTVVKCPEYPVDIMPADAYDQCDVVPSYEGLKISGHKMKNLEKSLEQLEGIVTNDINKLLCEDIDIKKIYTLAMNLALEFHLHSDMYHSLKAFYSAFSIAVCSQNKIFIIECGGHLLRYLKNNKLQRHLEDEVSHLTSDEQNLKYLIQYYINLSHLYLSQNNVPLAIEHFEISLKYSDLLNEVNEKYFWSIDISLELLRFKLMRASRMSKLATGIESSFGPLMKAHNLMVQKYSTEIEWGPNSMLLFFDVLESMVKMYHDLKMPREVRCFGKQSLIVAQQHHIPMHSVRFLTYLAHADFRSERLDDCRVKLDGISEILLLEHDKRSKPHISETVSSVDRITEGTREILLDEVKKGSLNIMASPSSPVYIGDPYKHPKFSDHKNCECFKCTCIEYQQLAVSRYHLEALWYMYKKQITLAKSFFKGTSEFYQILTVKKNVFPKNFPLTPHFSIDTNSYSEKKLCLEEYNYQCSIDYVKFLYSSGAKESARKHSHFIAGQLKSEKHIYPNLYGEVLLLRLGIIFHNRMKDKEPLVALSIPCRDDSDCKTPQRYTSQIMIPKGHSPKIKRFLPSKVITFSLADLDEEGTKTPSKIISKESKSSSKTPRNKILPPSLRSIKTPLLNTPYRKVSADDISKTSLSVNPKISKNEAPKSKTAHNMKRHPLFEIPEPSVECDNNLVINKTDVVIKDPPFHVKTKLLTAKLKKNCDETGSSSDPFREMHLPSARRSTRRKRL